jgi:hypothetical protein
MRAGQPSDVVRMANLVLRSAPDAPHEPAGRAVSSELLSQIEERGNGSSLEVRSPCESLT